MDGADKMSEDKECNTCAHYEPFGGVCKQTGELKHGYDGEDCQKWVDWEEYDER